MNHAFIHTGATALMLVCLCAPCTVDAGIKPPPEERTMPLTAYEPPGFHTNQGGRSAGSDDPFKPDQELTMITLLDILVPGVSSQGNVAETVLSAQEPFHEAGRKYPLQHLTSAAGPIEQFNHHVLYTVEHHVQPAKNPSLTLVPAPGALVLLIGGGLVRTRRRRRT